MHYRIYNSYIIDTSCMRFAIQYMVEDGKQLGVDYFSGYYSSMMTLKLVQFYRFTLCALALVSLEVKGKRIRVRIFRL